MKAETTAADEVHVSLDVRDVEVGVDIDDVVVEVVARSPTVDVALVPSPDVGVTVLDAGVEVAVGDPTVDVTTLSPTVGIEVVGARGEKGDTGPEGPQGPVGPSGAGNIAYRHVQDVISSAWTIVHPLTFQPHVTVVVNIGTGLAEVGADIEYISDTEVKVVLDGPATGEAYLT